MTTSIHIKCSQKWTKTQTGTFTSDSTHIVAISSTSSLISDFLYWPIKQHLIMYGFEVITITNIIKKNYNNNNSNNNNNNNNKKDFFKRRQYWTKQHQLTIYNCNMFLNIEPPTTN